MINKKLFKTIRSSYIPLLGQDLIESSAFTTILLMIVTKLGPESTSAYNVIFVVLGAINLPIYAYGNSIMTIISKAYGSKEYSLIKEFQL